MSDLKRYISEREKRDKKFADGYDEGYEQFKVGVMLRNAREEAALTQEERLAGSGLRPEPGISSGSHESFGFNLQD